MDLSDGDKLIIAMLAEILKAHVAGGYEPDIDPDRILKSLHSGNMWSIKSEYNGLFDAEEAKDEVRIETLAILDMWQNIGRSFRKLDKADKGIVLIANGGSAPEFPGFDGNKEIEHFAVAKHTIEYMEWYSDFQINAINSHTPQLDDYRKMLPKYKSIISSGTFPLSAEELVEIIDAGK